MKRYTITTRIKKGGAVEATLEGIKGRGCAGKLDFLKAVGTAKLESNTAEFNQCESVGVDARKG